MKKFLKLILIIGIALCLVMPVTSNQMANANGSNSPKIISPTHMEFVGETLYIYDDYTATLHSFNPQNSTLGAHITLNAGESIQKLVSNGSELFVLVKSESSTTLNKVTGNTLTQITFDKDYSLSLVTDLTFINSTLYTLKDGNIDYSTLSNTTLSPFVTIEKGNLFGDTNNVTLTQLSTHNGELIGATQTEAYLIHPSSQNVEKKVTLTNNETISLLSSNKIVTSKGELIDLISGEKSFPFGNVTPTGITERNNELFVSSCATHQALKLAGNTLTDLEINPSINVNHFSGDKFISAKTTAETGLKYMPYSPNPTEVLPAGTYLNLIGDYGDFYYALYVKNGYNHLLFVEKSAGLEVISSASAKVTYTATRNLNIFSLPSTSTNQNPVIGSIKANEELVVQTSSTISNSAGELFFLTKVGDDYGFIRSNFLQSTKGTVELTTPCNAKTKRETTLHENPDGTGKVITLEKSTRIALLEELSPNKDYIKVEYQDPNGIVYIGYINSDDISKDGLSTLQILGLVLVGTNLALLTTILLIKRRSKKWKPQD